MTEEAQHPDVNQALIAGLATKAGELANVAEDLVTTVRLNKVARSYLFVITVFLLGVCVIVLWGTVVINKNTEKIISCTEPVGKCYKDGRKSAKENLKLINDTSVAAAYCAKQVNNDTLEEIRKCIVATLSKD